MANKKIHEQCVEVCTIDENIRYCIEEGHYILVILRGVSGSGKTTLAQKLAGMTENSSQHSKNVKIFTQDEGETDEFHKNFKSSFVIRIPLIIMDMENIDPMKIQQFAFQASRNSYEIYCLEPNTSWKYMAEECLRRSSRNETLQSISAKIQQLINSAKIENVLPPDTQLKIQSYAPFDYKPIFEKPQPTAVFNFGINKKEEVSRETSPTKGLISLTAPKKKVVQKRNVLSQVTMLDIAKFMADVDCNTDGRIPEVYTVDAQVFKPQTLDRSTQTNDSNTLTIIDRELELDILFSIFTPDRKVEDILHDYNTFGYAMAYKLSLEEGCVAPRELEPLNAVNFYEEYGRRTDSSTISVGNVYLDEKTFLGKLQKFVKHEVPPGEYADTAEYPHLTDLVKSDEVLAKYLQAEEEGAIMPKSPVEFTKAESEWLKELTKVFKDLSFLQVKETFEIEDRKFVPTFDTLRFFQEVGISADEYIIQRNRQNPCPIQFSFSNEQQLRRTYKTDVNPYLREAQAEAERARTALEESMRGFGGTMNSNLQRSGIESILRQEEYRKTTKKFQEIDNIIRDGHSSAYHIDLHFMSVNGAIDFLRDTLQQAQRGPFEFPEEYEAEEDHSFEKDILVIPNRFPKRLNWFCNPRNDLMRDRLCMGEIDAYALACADDSPPIQLVPFCLGYKHQCAKANYPSEEWCEKEFDRYDKFCTTCVKAQCFSYTHDLSCYCEPYDNIWRRNGFETARWCQKYELICDEKKRRDKGTELVQLMQDKIKVHYRCLHLFNLPSVICDPFSTRFDWYRCMKFLFDCELISDWDDDEYDDVGIIHGESTTTSKPKNAHYKKEEISISDQAENLLKSGLTKDQLAANAAVRDKEKQIETILKGATGK